MDLGTATTRELLEEVAVRMTTTQNSVNGYKLAELCREGLLKLDGYILDIRTTQPDPWAGHYTAGYNCLAPKPTYDNAYIGDPYCPVCPPRSAASSIHSSNPWKEEIW
jgi:hypothetical protein